MANASFINLYENQAGYNAETHGVNGSEVSLIEDANKVVYDGVNVELPEGVVPSVGTALWVDGNGGKHFYEGSSVDAAKLTAQGLTFVGIVVLSKGRKAMVLHNEESTDIRFASCWAWKITGLTYGSEQSIVFQQVAKSSPYAKVNVGTCTFTPSDTDDAVSKIDTWLRANPGDTDTCFEYNWHCAKINGGIWVIADFGEAPNYRQYVELQGSGTTDGVKCETTMWTFAGYVTDYSQVQRVDGKVGGSTLWNTSRAKQYMATSGNMGTPTDTDPDDSAGIYAEANFTAANCPNTYAKYNGNYDAYIDSKLIKYPSSAGAMPAYAGDGRRANAAMASVSYVPLAGGNPVKMFTAVDYAKQRKAHATASVTCLNAGDWFIPGFAEAFEIFSQMSPDGSDKINSAFVKSGGTARSLSVYRWIPARSGVYSSWVLYSYGSVNTNYFITPFTRACAVAVLEF
jgi:hypothetical protein